MSILTTMLTTSSTDQPLNTTSSPTFAGLTTTGSFSPSQTNGIVGTTTNNNVSAGRIGEYISSSVLAAAEVSLTSPNAANVTSISLTAGDWDVQGSVIFDPAATTVISTAFGGISTTTAAIPTAGSENNVGGIFATGAGALAAGLSPIANMGPTRISIASTTTVYLVAQSTFTTSTNKAYGFIGARRVR